MDAYVSRVVEWLRRSPPSPMLEPEMMLVYGEAGCGKSRVVSLACEEVESEFGGRMAWDSLHGFHSVSDVRSAMSTDLFSECPNYMQKYARVLDGVEADVLLEFVRSEKRNMQMGRHGGSSLMGCHGGWLLVVITCSTFMDDEAIKSCFQDGLRIERLPELGDVERLLREKAWPVLNNVPVAVGTHILQACEGSPLAISILGGLVSAAGSWDVLTSEQLATSLQQYRRQNDDETVLLRIGYEALADGVKWCFLYTCLMFPLNQVLSRIKLGSMWFAEGLVGPNPDVAEQWILQLLQRNLLERVGGIRGGGDPSTDVIMVLQPMRNFAFRLASSYYCINDYSIHQYSSKSQVQHASMLLSPKTTLSIVIKFENLRTLHVWGAKNCKRPQPPPDAHKDPLSALSSLNHLVHLLLSAAYNGKTIKSVKRGGFPQLQHLYIMHFPNLITWNRILEGTMPNLQSLTIENCPGLRGQPPEGLGNNVAFSCE